MKLRCPNCSKEINQAEIQIPNSTESTDWETISVLLPKTDLSGVTYGDLVYKDGKYHLVFGVIVVCPHCKENFCYDIWLPTENQG